MHKICCKDKKRSWSYVCAEKLTSNIDLVLEGIVDKKNADHEISFLIDYFSKDEKVLLKIKDFFTNSKDKTHQEEVKTLIESATNRLRLV